MKVLIGPNPYGLEEVIAELASKHPDLELAHCPDRHALDRAIADAGVYLGWVERRSFLKAKALKWIQSPSSGVDKFLSIPELKEGDVILTSAVGTHAAALADHTFAMILALSRDIRSFVLYQERHRWTKEEMRPRLRVLTGSTLGIVGFGSVGREIAKRSNGFGMRILAVDLLPSEKPSYVERLDSLAGLKHLLRESDYVVVTVPYTPATHGMLNQEHFALLKPSAILVGISRGEIIDESALLEHLRTGRLAAAALDVFEEEPLPEGSPLWDVPNLLITPHVAGGTQFEKAKILEIFAGNLELFLQGRRPLRNEVDKGRGF